MYDKATAKKLKFKEKIKTWFSSEGTVLVYTMGKVGSSTIVNSIRKAGLMEVQPHSLTFSRRGSYFVLPEKNKTELAKDLYKTILMKIKVAVWKKLNQNKKIKVITLVREPISRNISAFFEQSHYISDDINELGVCEVERLFWKYANHDAPLRWFDDEIKKVFGIDIYCISLNKDKYSIVSKNNVDILVLRLENLSSYESVIGDFLGKKNFKIINANIGTNKAYSHNYKKFKESISIPMSYINKMYNSNYMKHFYSKEEIEMFIKKYKN